jgi:hypothetical protein
VSVTAARQAIPANEGVRASRAPLPTDDGKSYATGGAKRTRGEGRCTRPAGCPGYGSCKWHAGNTPNGRRAAQLGQARDSLEGLGVPLVGTNPLDLLDDLIDQSAAIVAYLREQVAALPTVLSGRRRPSARAALRTGARPSGPRGL